MEAGRYPVASKGSAGCDSVATLILTISQATTSTTTKEVCPAQLPYSWNGNSYNAAGSYPVTLKGSAGCDSIATLILTVGQATTSTTTKEVCPAQHRNSGEEGRYADVGGRRIILKESARCDSRATSISDRGQGTASSTSNVVCPAQLPYSWNGNSYNAAGSYPVALKGSAGCDSIATLILTVGQATTSTTTKEVCPAQLPSSWNGNSYHAAASYPVPLKGSAGCDS